MASSALKAHLHTSHKIVNDSHTFLLWDFSYLCCDCCLQFTNCLRIVLIHIILAIPPQIKIWGVQVWWMRYVVVLMKSWASLGRRRGIDRDEQWFRQDDGQTPHTTNDSLAWLRERFKDRLISRKCEIGFKSTKFEEIWWTYVGLINIFRGSFFLGGHPV